MKILPTIFSLFALLMSATVAAAWEADANNKLQVRAAHSIEVMQERVPRTQDYFEQSFGYAIFPSVTRVGLGFGGAYGKGVVVSGDTTLGVSKFWQFTSGIQGGAKNFSMIIFFRDQQALEDFQSGKLQFMGQAGVAAGTFGAAGTPTYNEGVALVTMTRFGLMAEFTISGARFSYKPVAGN